MKISQVLLLIWMCYVKIIKALNIFFNLKIDFISFRILMSRAVVWRENLHLFFCFLVRLPYSSMCCVLCIADLCMCECCASVCRACATFQPKIYAKLIVFGKSSHRLRCIRITCFPPVYVWYVYVYIHIFNVFNTHREMCDDEFR